MSQKLTYKSPIDLTAKVIETICERIESTKPIATSDKSAAIQVTEKQDIGSEIKFNGKAIDAQICVNGEAKTVKVYVLE